MAHEPVRRRRRVRAATRTVPPGEAGAESTATAEIADDACPDEAPEADSGPSERGLRGLVGGGSSQVSPAAALRARDAARPRDVDLARAERELVIVRRYWTPRD